MQRTILHCDMNNFYASAECMLDQSLRGHPVAGAETQRTVTELSWQRIMRQRIMRQRSSVFKPAKHSGRPGINAAI